MNWQSEIKLVVSFNPVKFHLQYKLKRIKIYA